MKRNEVLFEGNLRAPLNICAAKEDAGFQACASPQQNNSHHLHERKGDTLRTKVNQLSNTVFGTQERQFPGAVNQLFNSRSEEYIFDFPCEETAVVT